MPSDNSSDETINPALNNACTDANKQREIRSFVIRSGRMTDSQRRALDEHLSLWSLNYGPEQPYFDFESIYGNNNPVWLEIGFGMGDSLYQMAAASPDINFLGIEVHTPGVGRLLRLVSENQLENVRVVAHDAVQVLTDNIAEHSLDRVNIYFPDPWHKTKHHKRRLVQPAFLTLLHSRMRQGGLLHIATDWVPYSEHVVRCLKELELFDAYKDGNPFVSADAFGRPETKFERRGQRLAHEIRDMAYRSC